MILEIILLPIVVTLIIFGLKELLSYQKLKRYSAQGVRTVYLPFKGIYGLLASSDKNDMSKTFREFIEESLRVDGGLVAVNTFDSVNPFLIISSHEASKEFFAKEHYTKKIPLIPNYNFGFLDMAGEKAMERRSLFKNFFDYQNLASLNSKISKLFEGYFIKIKSENWSEDPEDLKQFKPINLHKIYNEIFSDITDIILMGEDSGNIKVQGMRIAEAIGKSVYLLMMDRFSLMNRISGGLTFNLKIGSQQKQAIAIRELLKVKIQEIYKKREKSSSRAHVNIIDLIIKNNSELPEGKKWTDEEILNHFLLF